MSRVLLARYASCIFWMARSIERAENLARILDVNETFSRDSEGAQNWRSIVDLYADNKAFDERYSDYSQRNVLTFYVLDRTHPSSIISTIRNARENARTLRPLISTEMWTQLNVFYNNLRELDEGSLAAGVLSRLFSTIKEACQNHTGITDGTFYRDQGWYFYQLGRYLERADQTTRLVDIKYHLLLPQNVDIGSAVDISQWSSLLRSAAGYHAFRRMHGSNVTPARVAGFLLMNQDFPRSVSLCISEANLLLTGLKSRYSLRGGNGALEVLDELRAMMAGFTIEQILVKGLHDFIDLIQLHLSEITKGLTASFFEGTSLPPGHQAMSQSLDGMAQRLGTMTQQLGTGSLASQNAGSQSPGNPNPGNPNPGNPN